MTDSSLILGSISPIRSTAEVTITVLVRSPIKCSVDNRGSSTFIVFVLYSPLRMLDTQFMISLNISTRVNIRSVFSIKFFLHCNSKEDSPSTSNASTTTTKNNHGRYLPAALSATKI